MDDFVVAVAQIGPVHGGSLVSLDDDGTRPHTDACLHQLEVVISPQS